MLRVWSAPTSRRLDASGAFPAGCHSGSYTGTRADVSRCTVVGLHLSSNNLSGALPARSLLALPTLTVLRLDNNSLTGGELTHSSAIAALEIFDISSNLLVYPPPANLHSACLSGRITCSGYPPQSCTACELPRPKQFAARHSPFPTPPLTKCVNKQSCFTK